MLEGRQVGPYDRRTIVGMRIKNTLTSDHLLRMWWRRPEVAPVEASCDAERALHAALIAEPRRVVCLATRDAPMGPALALDRPIERLAG